MKGDRAAIARRAAAGRSVLPRILIVGSARCSTGFGRVVHGLCDSLHSAYDIHVLGYDVFEERAAGRWRLHPGNPRDVFGTEQLPGLHAALRPEITLIINDYWFVPAFLAALDRSPHHSRIAVYVPIDARLRDPRRMAPLKEVDGAAVYTEFGHRILLEAFAAGAEVDADLPLIAIIPHGIATQLFGRAAEAGVRASLPGDRLAARRALYGADPRTEGFWVLNANRNSRRKRLDLTMIGFSLFARDKPPNVRLYLHAGRKDTGQDLLRIARNLGLGDRLILTADTPSHPVVSTERLNLIYRACEVGVNTSVGEGWGLVAFEHGAAGAAQIVPHHSAFAELWTSAAVFVEPVASVRMGDYLEGEAVAPEDVASALERLYSDPGYLAEMSRAAYLNATRKEWSWAVVGSLWDRFFRALLERPAPRVGCRRRGVVRCCE